MFINAMERVNENERFVVKNGIKWIYTYVTMIDQVVLSCLNRNSHIFTLIDRSISEKKNINIWLESRNMGLLVDIQIWNSNDVWWGNMQVSHHPELLAPFPKCLFFHLGKGARSSGWISHTLMRDFSYFYQIY